jgi:leucine rich repeat protein, bspA family
VEDKISPDDYELSTDGLTLIKWKNPNTKVLDMNRDTHLSKIKFIGDWAFWDCNGLTSINIPNSVTSIGEWAFMQCSSLTSINIPNSVTSIKHYAFYGCINLASVVFKGNNPPKIPSFDSYVFNETPSNLKLIIPKGAKNRYIKAGYPEDKMIEQ